MAENNLTTAARAATRNAYGVRIKDPSNKDSIITRKPDDNGVVDLSDLSTGSTGRAAIEFSTGEAVGTKITNLDDYHKIFNSYEGVNLIGVNKDLSNIPNGISVILSNGPQPITVSGKELASDFKLESPVTLTYTKAQLLSMLNKAATVTDNTPGTIKSTMYIDPSTPNPVSVRLSSGSTTVELVDTVKTDTMTLRVTYSRYLSTTTFVKVPIARITVN